MNTLFLGMALQAFIVATLTALGLITPTPVQQVVAGTLLVIAAFLIG